MTTFLITRHPGAVVWVAQQGLQPDVVLSHLESAELARIRADDVVYGTLPVNLAEQVCARGARFFNLSLDVPVHLRGRELSAQALARHGARWEAFHVESIAC